MRGIGLVLAVLAVAMFVGLSGCASAQHYGGDTAGKRPGLKASKGILGSQLEFTGEGSTSVAKAEYTTKDGTKLTIEDAQFNQRVQGVIEKETGKLKGITDLQAEQTRWATQFGDHLVAFTREVVSPLNILASAPVAAVSGGVQITIPNGTQIGTHSIRNPQDWVDAIRELGDAAAKLKGVPNVPATQPAAAVATQPAAKTETVSVPTQ